MTSLRLYLGELRELTFKGRDGSRLEGAAIIDGLWQGIAHWATVLQPKLQVEQQRTMLTERIAQHPEALRVQRAFDALEDA